MILRNVAVDWHVKTDVTDLFALERLMQRMQRGFLALGAAGALAFKAIFGSALEFEDSLARTMAYVDRASDQFENLRSKWRTGSKDMAEKFGVSSTEILDDMRNILNLGIDPLDEGFEELVDVLNKLKIVGESDPLKSVRTIQKAKVVWPEMSYAEIANDIFIASKIAPNFVEEIAMAGNKALSIAKAMGQTLPQTLAVLSQMSTMSVSGSQLGTRLFSGMALMMSGAGRSKKALATLGLKPEAFKDPATGHFRSFVDIFKIINSRMQKFNEFTRTRILLMLTGRRVSNAYIPILLQELAVLDGFVEKFGDIESLQQAFNTRMESGAKGGLRFAAAMKNLVDTIGGPMDRVWKRMSMNIGGAVVAIRKFLERTSRLTGAVSVFTALGLAVVVLGSAMGMLAASIMLVQAAMTRLNLTGAMLWPKLFLMPMLAAIVFIAFLLVLEDLVASYRGWASAIDLVADKLGISVEWLRALSAAFVALSVAFLFFTSQVLFGIAAVLLVIGLVVILREELKNLGDTAQAVLDILDLRLGLFIELS